MSLFFVETCGEFLEEKEFYGFYAVYNIHHVDVIRGVLTDLLYFKFNVFIVLELVQKFNI